MDSPENLMALPADPATSQRTGLPVHNGSHPNYDNMVRWQLYSVLGEYGMGQWVDNQQFLLTGDPSTLGSDAISQISTRIRSHQQSLRAQIRLMYPGRVG